MRTTSSNLRERFEWELVGHCQNQDEVTGNKDELLENQRLIEQSLEALNAWKQKNEYELLS